MNWLSELLCPTIRNRSAPTPITSHTTAGGPFETEWRNFRQKVKCDGDYELHDILAERGKIDWPIWHLTIDENDKTLEIAKGFHQKFENLKLSSSIAGYLFPIKEVMLKSTESRNEIEALFNRTFEENNPQPIIGGYTLSQKFSENLHKHSAANTFHSLKLYCTLLNCPILARTQQYTEAFTSILFHPTLDRFLVQNKTVYRGSIVKNDISIAEYNEGDIIITTTFLSTSMNSRVAEIFASGPREDEISVFSTYNIHGTCRRTALDIEPLSSRPHEEEILILRYVPFIITSIIRRGDGRRMEITFDEYTEPRIRNRQHVYSLDV